MHTIYHRERISNYQANGEPYLGVIKCETQIARRAEKEKLKKKREDTGKGRE